MSLGAADWQTIMIRWQPVRDRLPAVMGQIVTTLQLIGGSQAFLLGELARIDA